jgi:D-xylose transport system ATP-binding protein
MRNISKRFPGVLALDDVSFDLYAGEIHALVGENGAGKSTLINVLGGVHDYEGSIVVEDDVAIVHQELSLIPEFSIAENISLGREPHRYGVIDWNALYSRAQRVLDQLQLRLDPHTITGTLGIGQQHLVEIAKALSHDARILVLDEPTAALTDNEAEVLFAILERLRERGVGIIYISHKLGEVFRLADRITVLRDGRAVSTDAKSSLDLATVIARMVGRDVTQFFPASARQPQEVVFEARNVRGVSFSARRGEVLGIAGLVGAGRSELVMAIFGADETSGEVFVDGTRVTINHPWDAIAAGIGFVTEDRKRYGLLLDQTVLMNETLAAPKTDLATAEQSMKELRIKAQSIHDIVGTLSGGNQQKVVLAKWLLTHPKVLFLDEPTRGIDIGAKQEIYQQIDRLTSEGMAIVLVSSELPEILGLSDRIIVLHKGRIAGEFDRQTATAEAVMACATGHAA